MEQLPVNACRDEPSELDICYEELFWADTQIPVIVDNRTKATVYSQRVEKDTKMACGSYGMRHIVNLYEWLGWQQEENPVLLWRKFVQVYKTDTYDPVTKWSSIQAQLDFAVKQWIIASYIKLKTVEQMKQSLSKGSFIYTGTSKVDRAATRKNKNVMVVAKTWAGHIIEIDGYDDQSQLFFVRNSSWRQAGDKWYLYLKYEDIGCLFSMYSVVEKSKTDIRDRIKAKIAEKKKTMVYEVRVVNGKKVLKRRPK